MAAEMKSYSDKYRVFTWIRLQSYRGTVFAGTLFTLFLKCAMSNKYRQFSEEYDEYIRAAGIDPPKGCKKAYIACLLVYGAHVKEFFLYDFMHLNDSGRREFVTEINRYKIYQTYNGAKKRIEMQDKYLAYEAFRKYYHREMMRITKDTTADALRDFFRNRDAGILKPNLAGCGRGVEIVRLKDFSSPEEAFAYILTKTDYVLEELVQQAACMQALHPQSVNTVRVYACRTASGIRIFGSHLRIGVGDSVVDNAAQGGVVVSITNDGDAWTSGVDEFGSTHICHPDTHVRLPGLRMPEWEKAVQLVTEAMDVFPDIRFVGWDLAYTDAGWIIIEANDNAQFYGAQMPYHKGLRKEIDRYFQE